MLIASLFGAAFKLCKTVGVLVPKVQHQMFVTYESWNLVHNVIIFSDTPGAYAAFTAGRCTLSMSGPYISSP